MSQNVPLDELETASAAYGDTAYAVVNSTVGAPRVTHVRIRFGGEWVEILLGLGAASAVRMPSPGSSKRRNSSGSQSLRATTQLASRSMARHYGRPVPRRTLSHSTNPWCPLRGVDPRALLRSPRCPLSVTERPSRSRLKDLLRRQTGPRRSNSTSRSQLPV
jgi:hypothetical protein